MHRVPPSCRTLLQQWLTYAQCQRTPQVRRGLRHDGLSWGGRRYTAATGASSSSPALRVLHQAGAGVRPMGRQLRKTKVIDPQVQKELIYLRDPLKHSNRVRDLLAEGRYDFALALTEAASSRMSCVVSWNHLVNHLMMQRRDTDAIKLYNQMKKRAQIPDAYTFALLFRGLAMAHHPKHAMGKALALYEAMQSPRSPVAPNIAHTNALLKVCARCGDLDTVFAVAAKLPQQGNGAPDSITWNTILTAIRSDVQLSRDHGVTPEQASARRQKAVLDGRRIWSDIFARWKAGNLQVDEELVVSMGQLLLLGEQETDWDDVLFLVRQTMQIPRMALRLPRRGTTKASGPDELAPFLGIEDGATQGRDDEHGGALSLPMEDSGDLSEVFEAEAMPSQPIDDSYDEDRERGEEFREKVSWRPTANRPRGRAIRFPQPGHATLSMILQACLKLSNKKAASAYWHFLTHENGIRPDGVNYHDYLRVLRVSRSAAGVLRVVQEMAERPDIKLEHKTFRIAMSACRRDAQNPNSYTHATRLMDLQDENKIHDVPTMTRYLEVALLTKDRDNVRSALQRLGTFLDSVDLGPSVFKGTKADNHARLTELRDLSALARQMRGAYTRFLNRSGAERLRQDEYRQQIRNLSALDDRILILLQQAAGGRTTRWSGAEQQQEQQEADNEGGKDEKDERGGE